MMNQSNYGLKRQNRFYICCCRWDSAAFQSGITFCSPAEELNWITGNCDRVSSKFPNTTLPLDPQKCNRKKITFTLSHKHHWCIFSPLNITFSNTLTHSVLWPAAARAGSLKPPKPVKWQGDGGGTKHMCTCRRQRCSLPAHRLTWCGSVQWRGRRESLCYSIEGWIVVGGFCGTLAESWDPNAGWQFGRETHADLQNGKDFAGAEQISTVGCYRICQPF